MFITQLFEEILVYVIGLIIMLILLYTQENIDRKIEPTSMQRVVESTFQGIRRVLSFIVAIFVFGAAYLAYTEGEDLQGIVIMLVIGIIFLMTSFLKKIKNFGVSDRRYNDNKYDTDYKDRY